MDKIFRLTNVAKVSDGDENFVQRKILSDIVLSDKVWFYIKPEATIDSFSLNSCSENFLEFTRKITLVESFY